MSAPVIHWVQGQLVPLPKSVTSVFFVYTPDKDVTLSQLPSTATSASGPHLAALLPSGSLVERLAEPIHSSPSQGMLVQIDEGYLDMEIVCCWVEPAPPLPGRVPHSVWDRLVAADADEVPCWKLSWHRVIVSQQLGIRIAQHAPQLYSVVLRNCSHTQPAIIDAAFDGATLILAPSDEYVALLEPSQSSLHLQWRTPAMSNSQTLSTYDIVLPQPDAEAAVSMVIMGPGDTIPRPLDTFAVTVLATNQSDKPIDAQLEAPSSKHVCSMVPTLPLGELAPGDSATAVIRYMVHNPGLTTLPNLAIVDRATGTKHVATHAAQVLVK